MRAADARGAGGCPALPDTAYAIGFLPWKQGFVPRFLPQTELRFVDRIDQVPRGATVLVWGRDPVADPRPDLAVLRMEDGFLRSAGLGAALIRPCSLVIDDLGIYFDATGPSRLEAILAERAFSDEDRARAAALREAIVAAGVSKYNLGGSGWSRPAGVKRVLLVVGQVESDASIRFGSPEVTGNLALLKRVRTENPDAHVLYKPHPDVVAGLRDPGSDEAKAAEWCDEVLPGADPGLLLTQVDEVHTMTSLLGFEALLRKLPVTCHGLPFYAGWGLTSDRLRNPRRTRRLALDELVHAALIDYPTYVSPDSGRMVEAEELLAELAARRPPGAVEQWLRRSFIQGWRRLSGRAR